MQGAHSKPSTTAGLEYAGVWRRAGGSRQRQLHPVAACCLGCVKGTVRACDQHVGALFQAGDAAPLPWLPVLNPMELAQLAVLVLALRWQVPAGGKLASSRIVVLSGLAFAWITSVVLHAVHHWGGASSAV